MRVSRVLWRAGLVHFGDHLGAAGPEEPPDQEDRELQNPLEEGELDPAATIRKFRIVRYEAAREVARIIDHYNLEGVSKGVIATPATPGIEIAWLPTLVPSGDCKSVLTVSRRERR